MLRIKTQHGHYYDITSDGNIIRLDQEGFKASGQWKLIAIVSYNWHQKRETIGFTSIGNWLAMKPQLLFKNGKPKYTVRDFDHGTLRHWGDGIVAMWWEHSGLQFSA